MTRSCMFVVVWVNLCACICLSGWETYTEKKGIEYTIGLWILLND